MVPYENFATRFAKVALRLTWKCLVSPHIRLVTRYKCWNAGDQSLLKRPLMAPSSLPKHLLAPGDWTRHWLSQMPAGVTVLIVGLEDVCSRIVVILVICLLFYWSLFYRSILLWHQSTRQLLRYKFIYLNVK